MAAEVHEQSYFAAPVCSVRGNPSTGNRHTAENVLWSSCEVGLIPYVVHVVCVPDFYSYGKPSSRSRDISQNILCSSCVVKACNVPDTKIVPLGHHWDQRSRRKCTLSFIERVLEHAVMIVKKC